MAVGSGYSLWLVPPKGELANRLQQTIEACAKTYNTHLFIPHVTLLADVHLTKQEMREKTRKLVPLFPSYKIQLRGELGSQGVYFRMLFAPVNMTLPVVLAHREATRAFNTEWRLPYFPHLSFAYGDLSPKQVEVLKKVVMQELPDLGEICFPVAAIELWSTIGTVPEWYLVDSFPLAQR